jgi:hypothetical protein
MDLKYGKGKTQRRFCMDRFDLAISRLFSPYCRGKIQNIISLIINVYVFNCIADRKRAYLFLVVL